MTRKMILLIFCLNVTFTSSRYWSQCILSESMEQNKDGCISNNFFRQIGFTVILLTSSFCLIVFRWLQVLLHQERGTSTSKTDKITKRIVICSLLVLSHITSSVWTSEIWGVRETYQHCPTQLVPLNDKHTVKLVAVWWFYCLFLMKR